MNPMKCEQSGPPLKREDIEKFEGLIGAKIPAGYRSFLLACNGGKPYPAHFEQTVSNQTRIFNQVVRFYVLLSEPDRKQSNLYEEWLEAQRELEPGWLPIGSDRAGEAICVCLKELDYGAVYATDGYVEYLGHKPEMRRLSDSFEGFIGLLFDQRSHEPADVVKELAKIGNREDVVRYLSQGGRITDKTQLDGSIAQTAAAYGNIEVLRFCIELDADISGALTIAILNKRWDTMRFLVKAGANVNEFYSENGKTPLQAIREIPRFICKERDSIEQYLRDHGAK
jgi:hypothetical protein